MNAQAVNLDAQQTMYFNRQLEVIKSQTYDIKQGNLRAVELFPVDGTTPEYAETQTYYQYDARGLAKIVSDYATDIPSLEVAGKAFTSKIETIALSYAYSIMDIKRASIQGTPLSVRKALATQRGVMARHNQLFWVGDTVAGIVGVLSHASVQVHPLCGQPKRLHRSFVIWYKVLRKSKALLKDVKLLTCLY
jgi:hypothetical protein